MADRPQNTTDANFFYETVDAPDRWPMRSRTDKGCGPTLYRTYVMQGESYGLVWAATAASSLNLVTASGGSTGITVSLTTAGDVKYGSLTIPSDLSPGNYFLGRSGHETSGTRIYVLDSAEVDKTLRLEARNTDPVLAYPWDLLPDDFWLSVRIPATVADQEPETSLKQYRSASTGKTRNLRTVSDELVRFRSLFLDDWAHRALSAYLNHDLLKINGRDVVLKTPYKRIYDEKSQLMNGEFEVIDSALSTQYYYGN